MPPRPPRPALLSQTIMIAAAAPCQRPPTPLTSEDAPTNHDLQLLHAARPRRVHGQGRRATGSACVGVTESRAWCVWGCFETVRTARRRQARQAGAEAANARSNRDRRGGTWRTGGRCPVRRTPTEILVSRLRRRRPWLSGVPGRYRPPLDTKNKEKSPMSVSMPDWITVAVLPLQDRRIDNLYS